MANPTFARLPGFRDFPPEDLAFRAHVFDAWRRTAVRYGFLEYDGPPLEPLVVSQGLRVFSPYQTSPIARAPSVVFASSDAWGHSLSSAFF